MYSLENVFSVLNKYAPLSLSKKMIENGEYDNSGILIKDHDEVKSVLFTLDLSINSVKRAKGLRCDTIVTHHPAIYNPIQNLSKDCALTSPVLYAMRNKINVISMHLNLDVASGGIDQSLCEGLGANKWKILSYLDEEHGYGREFCIKDIKFVDYVKKIEKEFNTKKLLAYGNKKAYVKEVASFCGAGGSYAEKEVLKNRYKK